MRNFIQDGETIVYENADVTGAAAISSGDLVIIGSLAGVAVVDIAVGGSGAVKINGVFKLPKTSAQAWTQGAPIYWDTSPGEATTSSGGNTLIGTAAEVADNPSDDGYVLLKGAAVS